MTKEEKEQMEKYKKAIALMVETSKDMDYLIAVYSFANSYEDKSKGAG